MAWRRARAFRRQFRAVEIRTVAGPSGVVTFLFTDIERSTRRSEADAAEMREALLAHDEVLRSSIEAHGAVHHVYGCDEHPGCEKHQNAQGWPYNGKGDGQEPEEQKQSCRYGNGTCLTHLTWMHRFGEGLR